MYEVLKEVLELLYFIASVILVVGVFVAIKHLKVVQSDIKTKNKRASVEKSVEYLNWFATEFIPEYAKLESQLVGKKVNIYPKIEKRDFVFNNELTPTSTNVQNSINLKIASGAINLNNQLEFFSAAMMSGLADEELAFNPLAEAFCEYVEFQYDVYCDTRKNGRDTLYTHTIALYKMWNERLESLNLQKERQKIDEKMSKISNQTVKVIGNE